MTPNALATIPPDDSFGDYADGRELDLTTEVNAIVAGIKSEELDPDEETLKDVFREVGFVLTAYGRQDLLRKLGASLEAMTRRLKEKR